MNTVTNNEIPATKQKNPESILGKIAALAAAYRQRWPHLPLGGWVACYSGQASGWISSLDNPASSVPGCTAIPGDEGPRDVAVGGNDSNGAKLWEPLVIDSPRAVVRTFTHGNESRH